MKKILNIIIVLSFLTTCICSAENWYAVSKYYHVGKEDKKTTLRTVTKVYDQDTCYNVMIDLSNLGINGIDWVEAECVSGEDFDEALYPVFSKKSGRGIYIFYIDLEGYDTILDFPDTPSEECILLTEELSGKLTQTGRTETEVVFPIDLQEKEEQTNFFTVGSTKQLVQDIQGKPTSIVGEVWMYGYDYVAFDDNGKVSEYSNVLDTLKVQ